MFFVAILGTYIVLRAGSPAPLRQHAAVLSKALAGLNTLVLIFSSLTMALAVDAAQKGDRKTLVRYLGLTLLCACGFIGIKAKEYRDKCAPPHDRRPRVDPHAASPVYVYDGHSGRGNRDRRLTLRGYRMPARRTTTRPASSTSTSSART